MVKLIETPTKVAAAGEPPKTIEEYVGRVNTGSDAVSVAYMRSPSGWQEPGQRPDFEEYTLVVRGALRVEYDGGELEVAAGQAVHTGKSERALDAHHLEYPPWATRCATCTNSTGPRRPSPCRRLCAARCGAGSWCLRSHGWHSWLSPP
ncbi:MAG: cupin domain-containing protein [Micromonosporaceae bacterium]